MNVAAAVILVGLAVIGAATVAREISLRLFCGREDGTVMLITRITDSENVELALRSALAKRRWSVRRTVCAVCVDCPMDERTRKICESLCREYGFQGLMTKEELLKSLE